MNSQSVSINNRPDNLLRNALRGNGLFSGISGLLFVVGAEPIAAFIGLPWIWSLSVVGVLLLGYAVALFYGASKSQIDWRVALTFTLMDIGWIVGSLILLFTDWIPFTLTGKWVVAILADSVAVFAALQAWGSWQRKPVRTAKP